MSTSTAQAASGVLRPALQPAARFALPLRQFSAYLKGRSTQSCPSASAILKDCNRLKPGLASEAFIAAEIDQEGKKDGRHDKNDGETAGVTAVAGLAGGGRGHGTPHPPEA